MATARPSFTKRQRETAKRERQQLKAAKRAARKNSPQTNDDMLDEPVAEAEVPAEE